MLFKTKQGKNLFGIINYSLLVLALVSFLANGFLIAKVNAKMGIRNFITSNQFKNLFSGKNGSSPQKLSGNLTEDAISLVMYNGVPEKYGQELNISFEQVQQAMDIVKQYDPDYGNTPIILSGDDKRRYIEIGLKISCEFCCGAKSIIFEDGKAACGCAHAQAMRGLEAYLIKNHGSEFNNDQVLKELAIWKGRYFPKQMVNKMSEQLVSGKYTPDIASLLLGLKLPKYSANSGNAPSPSEINNLPGQVGGC